MNEYRYAGTELPGFDLATNWKHYYHRLVEPYLQGQVLEVGAGIGATTRSLCTPGKHARWVCLEPDPTLAGRIKERIAAGELPASCEVRTGTLSDFDPRDLYDTILYADVLEHIEDDRAESMAAARHLKPGGHLIVVAPAHQSLYTPFDAAIGHFRRYDKTTLAMAVPPHLRTRMLSYVDAIGALASMANRYLLRSATPTDRQILFWDGVLVPLSRIIDPLLRYRAGKSIIGVWERLA